MLFSEALKALEAGEYVTRRAWNDGSYIALLPTMIYIWRVCSVPNPAAGNWIPFATDLAADDWITLIDGKLPVNETNGVTDDEAPAAAA